MIDTWLIFAQTIPFVQVILFTLRDVVDLEQRQEAGKRKIAFAGN